MRAVAGLPSVASAAVIVGMLWMSNRGLEMIDEGYLLRLTADPEATRTAGEVYLFGFLLHPLYEAVGRDIALFRAVGILVLSVGAAALGREAVALLRARDKRLQADGPDSRAQRAGPLHPAGFPAGRKSGCLLRDTLRVNAEGFVEVGLLADVDVDGSHL